MTLFRFLLDRGTGVGGPSSIGDTGGDVSSIHPPMPSEALREGGIPHYATAKAGASAFLNKFALIGVRVFSEVSQAPSACSMNL